MAATSNRKANTILLVMLVWVNAVLLYIDRGLLSAPVFWLGYLVFGSFGAFILGTGRRTLERLGRILTFLVLVISSLIYVVYPASIVFTAGFVGLFTGLAVRVMLRDPTRGRSASAMPAGSKC